mgnify:CR=1 FL=1
MEQTEIATEGGKNRGKLDRFPKRQEVIQMLLDQTKSITEINQFCKDNGLEISDSALVQQREKLLNRKQEVKSLIADVAEKEVNFSKDINEVIKKLIDALKDAPSDLLVPQTTKEASNLASAISNLGKYSLELSGKGSGDKTLILNILKNEKKGLIL